MTTDKRSFLYHVHPKEIRGDEILPLNKLVVSYPDLAEFYRGNYQDREHVTKRRIPILECLWNDVIHLTNIPPNKFFLALQSIGRSPDPALRWLKIPVELALENPTVVYSCRTTTEDRSMIPSDEVSRFELSKFCTGELDKRTIEYYQRRQRNSERILLFQGIAHFLMQGEISISKCDSIVWSEDVLR